MNAALRLLTQRLQGALSLVLTVNLAYVVTLAHGRCTWAGVAVASMASVGVNNQTELALNVTGRKQTARRHFFADSLPHSAADAVGFADLAILTAVLLARVRVTLTDGAALFVVLEVECAVHATYGSAPHEAIVLRLRHAGTGRAPTVVILVYLAHGAVLEASRAADQTVIFILTSHSASQGNYQYTRPKLHPTM